MTEFLYVLGFVFGMILVLGCTVGLIIFSFPMFTHFFKKWENYWDSRE